MPDALSFEEAATLPCAAVTAWHALIGHGDLQAGQTVLTLGTGGVSLFALQIAKMHGARVIITSSSDEKAGAGEANSARMRRSTTRRRRIGSGVSLNSRARRGVDHVIELGGAGTLQKSLDAVALRRTHQPDRRADRIRGHW